MDYFELKGMNRAMVLKTSGDLGEVTISNNVISEIAGAVATKCYGVVGMASRNKKDGIVNLLKPDSMTKTIWLQDHQLSVLWDTLTTVRHLYLMQSGKHM